MGQSQRKASPHEREAMMGRCTASALDDGRARAWLTTSADAHTHTHTHTRARTHTQTSQLQCTSSTAQAARHKQHAGLHKQHSTSSTLEPDKIFLQPCGSRKICTRLEQEDGSKLTFGFKAGIVEARAAWSLGLIIPLTDCALRSNVECGACVWRSEHQLVLAGTRELWTFRLLGMYPAQFNPVIQLPPPLPV